MKSAKQQRADTTELNAVLQKCLLAYGFNPVVSYLANAIEELANAERRVPLWPDDEHPLHKDDLLQAARNLRDGDLFKPGGGHEAQRA